MPVRTLRPSSLVTTVPSRFSVHGGAASGHGALSDNNDSTFIRRSSNGGTFIGVFKVSAAGSGSGTIVHAAIRGRANVPSGENILSASLVLVDVTGNVTYGATRSAMVTSTLATHNVGISDSLPAGTPWSWGRVASELGVRVQTPDLENGPVIDVREMYVDIYSVMPPEIIPTVVNGPTITNTVRPSFSFALRNVVETWQLDGPYTHNLMEMRIFDEATYSQPGFNPRTSPNAVASNANVVTINYIEEPWTTNSVPWTSPAPLPNGTYRVYVWADRNGVVGTTSVMTFTVNVPPSNPPVFDSIEMVDNGALVQLDLTPTAPHTAPLLDRLQRAVVRQGVPSSQWAWEDVPLYNLEALPNNRIRVLDYSPPRPHAFAYRARAETYIPDTQTAALTAYSAPSAPVVSPHKGWWFRIPTDTFKRVAGEVRVIGEPTTERGEDIAIFRPIGRTTPVVLHGALQGSDGEYDIVTSTVAEWSALQAVLDSQQPVLVETGFLDRKWITFMPYQVKRRGTPTAPRREISAPYIEVAAPPVLPWPSETR